MDYDLVDYYLFLDFLPEVWRAPTFVAAELLVALVLVFIFEAISSWRKRRV